MFQRLILWVVLLGLLLVGSPSVFAQDVPSDTPVAAPPPAEDNYVSQGWEIFRVVLLGVATVIVLVVGLAVLVYLGAIIRWATQQFLLADAKLATFGQSPTGHFIYSSLGTLSQRLDDPNDTLIRAGSQGANQVLAALLPVLHKVLPDSPDLLSDQIVLQGARTVLGAAKELLNGQPLPQDLTPEALAGRFK